MHRLVTLLVNQEFQISQKSKSFLSSKGIDYKFDSDPVKEAVVKSIPIPVTVYELVKSFVPLPP